MPNWCENRLEISGNHEQLDLLLSKLLRKPTEADTADDVQLDLMLDFNLLIPMPKSLKITCGSTGQRALMLLSLPPEEIISLDVISTYWSANFVKWIAHLKEIATITTYGDLIRHLEAHPEQQAQFCINLALGRAYQANLEQYQCSTWYDWCCAHWGCKWNADTQHISGVNRALTHQNESFSLYIDFNTAWSPPTPWVQVLMATFPELTITLIYFEAGCFYAGRIFSEAGSKHHIYHEMNDMAEILEIAEEFGYERSDFFDDEE